MPESFKFVKESVISSSDATSPFFNNLPSHEAKPIDNLIEFFKFWKYFIKSLIYYFNEIALVKQFEANVSLQLINTVQFPGYKDLPVKVTASLKQQSPSSSDQTTPTKENIKPFSSATSLAKDYPKERPGLKKTKSNNSVFALVTNEVSKTLPNANFLKNPIHKRGGSLTSLPDSATNANVHHNDLKIPANFFPPDSLFTNLAPLLIEHHQQSYNTNIKLYNDLQNKLIPRLNTLNKTLSLKIKEIKTSLRNDSFANSELITEISKTGTILSDYMSAVEYYSGKCPVLSKRKAQYEKMYAENDEEEASNIANDDEGAPDDPFLIKLQVDYQIKKHLTAENYMFASYVNLQNISRDLFTYVMKELNIILDKFGKAELNNEIYRFFKTKISSSSTNDWEHFISNNVNFLNIYKDTPVQKKHEIRYFKNLTLPYANSIHNKCIRSGLLYKKSKVLKSYTKYYYILTCNYLHEFKIENEDNANGGQYKKQKDKIGGYIGYKDVPIKSYNLNEYQISVKDENSFKFQLSKYSKNATKYTFRCVNLGDFRNWFGDLQELLKFAAKHYERFALVQAKFAAKELEEKQAAENAKQHLKESTNSTPASLGADSLKNGKNHLNILPESTNSLSGIYEPHVKTPSTNFANEINPFEKLVSLNEIESIPPSADTSGSSGQLTPTIEITAASLSLSSSDNTPIDPQTYQRMQQHLLKQREELIAKQLQKIALEKEQQKLLDASKAQQSGTNHLHTFHPHSSSESINSFIPKGPSIQAFLNSNPIAEQDKKVSNDSEIELPQVFVSDH